MPPPPDGLWSIAWELPPGSYEYRFVVDGLWGADPNAADVVRSPFGDNNAVRRVSGTT
jgi:hypothetical protein